LTSGEHTKGHTELPWRIKTTGNIGNAIEAHAGMPPRFEGDDGYRTVCMVQSCCPSDSLADDERTNFEANRNLIITAVNTYPYVAELVKALEDCKAVLGDNDLMFHQRVVGASKVMDSALTRFREAQAGGGA